ncbi:uncharacterized protein A1O5_12381 [Cladophialophora psammophila CBS 110553]|uniref:Alcohol dehydrogenase n=1 Tax=Cladophialophora psammophila CBS 110553 TaxID=1182543 RepID=W9VQI9_9EURO|nr:uncharacterized protein A1O5_12381 [Cladophialophora psammophila CBS 110553]EXJ57823.1 hypothetical protein A1O5_12381 [Cladophialophora psammophila CBS 110553]
MACSSPLFKGNGNQVHFSSKSKATTTNGSSYVSITGANSGVGYATYQVLATTPDYDFHVIMPGRSLDKVEASRTELATSCSVTSSDISSRLSTLKVDVTDSSSIRAAADAVFRKWGYLDVLINNAVIGATSLDDDTSTRFTMRMQTTVTGPAVMAYVFRLLLLKAPVKPYSIFVPSGTGSFARTADTTRQRGPEPPGDTSAYHASKAAFNMIALKGYLRYREEIKVFAMTTGFVVSNLCGKSEELRTGWRMTGDHRCARDHVEYIEEREGRGCRGIGE